MPQQTSQQSALIEHWNKLCDGLGIPRDLIDHYASIVNHYKEPHRHYHTVKHLEQCFKELAWLERSVKVPCPDAIRAAIFFHDIVYDPRRADNEEQSAAFAEMVLRRLGVRESFIARVNRYILATKSHDDPGDLGAQYFLDIDLSILGQPALVFAEYERHIRQEYLHVPLKAYRDTRTGRPAILRRFLDREHIFFTEPFRKKYEAVARANLAHSVACMVE